MRRLLIAVIAGLFVALGSMAQGLSGAALLTIMSQPDVQSIDKYVSAKGYQLLDWTDETDAFANNVWGINVGYYRNGRFLPANSSKPMYMLIVEFTGTYGNNMYGPPARLKYRPSTLAGMRSVLSYFRKSGYKNIGYDYVGAHVYHKSGAKYNMHYHESGRTIYLIPAADEM